MSRLGETTDRSDEKGVPPGKERVPFGLADADPVMMAEPLTEVSPIETSEEIDQSPTKAPALLKVPFRVMESNTNAVAMRLGVEEGAVVKDIHSSGVNMIARVAMLREEASSMTSGGMANEGVEEFVKAETKLPNVSDVTVAVRVGGSHVAAYGPNEPILSVVTNDAEYDRTSPVTSTTRAMVPDMEVTLTTPVCTEEVPTMPNSTDLMMPTLTPVLSEYMATAEPMVTESTLDLFIGRMGPIVSKKLRPE
mmetsp:Transcript_42618/g.70933  ORF Transcript_42618/g.70933 Transcript_42618/m.70933 type:complete len:251 (-) Transcript_42618:509-1261(-)